MGRNVMNRMFSVALTLIMLLSATGAFAESGVTNMIPLVRPESAEYMLP